MEFNKKNIYVLKSAFITMFYALCYPYYYQHLGLLSKLLS